MPKRSTITCRDTEKTKNLALVSNLKSTRIRLESLPFSVPWFIVLSVWVSAVYAKYVSTPIHSVEFPQKKIPFPSKPGFPLSALIILVWYPYVSLIPDLWCYRFECQRFTQNTFQRLYTRSNFHHKPGFPLSALIILVWYPYVSLFPDLLCNIGLSVSGLRKIRFNAYTPRRISTKNQFPNKPGFPLSELIILDCSNVNLNWNWKNKNHDQ